MRKRSVVRRVDYMARLLVPTKEAQQQARAFFAKLTNSPERKWSFVTEPKPLVWYDYASPDGSDYGQCLLGEDGRWIQAPKSENVVLLAWHKTR